MSKPINELSAEMMLELNAFMSEKAVKQTLTRAVEWVPGDIKISGVGERASVAMRPARHIAASPADHDSADLFTAAKDHKRPDLV